ncbi:hypothetical protein LMJ38_14170 [Streptomyces sp. R1]|uniref:hypothetical protein n=1 Tax=Streptomyces sp. R1 TaxID=1509279 RepID=UPI001E405006|nr:hypothetical protein [Streptomyces sp. R1]MCC8337078.1 hypothetical protein [Streptomyces sp. R1]
MNRFPQDGPGQDMLSLPRLGLLGGAVAGTGLLLVLLLDGPEAAGALVALLAAVAVLVARYVTGAGAVDSAYRDEVRLLRTRAPGMGEWWRNVKTSTGPDGAPYYRAVLRIELRRLYSAALAEHHHVSLEHQPERAAELVGPELWPWLGPVPPGTGPEGEVPVDVLRRLVDRLEALGAPRTRSPLPRPRTSRTGKDQAT